MKIAIDIDEVLRETLAGFCEFYNKTHKGHLVFKDFRFYGISKVLGISHEGAHKLFDEYFLSEDFKSVALIPYATEVIPLLRKSHELVAVTASPSWMRDMTWEFLNTYFSDSFSDLIFSGEHYLEQHLQGKDEICKALGVDLIIEDSFFSQRYAEGGLRVLLLDKPWNKDVKHKNVTRCNCWKEILSEIRRFEEIGK